MRLGAALTGALLGTLATPASWPLALAGFLLRGGILLVVLPIVVLPSPVGLGNLLAPALLAVVFEGVTVEVAATATLATLSVVTWIVVGGLIAAAVEADVVRLVAAADVPSWLASRRTVALRILAVRLLAHLPTGAALLWGSIRLVDLAYRELTSPADVTTPIVLRVLGGAPEVSVLLLAAWVLGETFGGLAARRIVLAGDSVASALRAAAVAVLGNALAVLAGFVVPLAGLVLVLLPATVASAVAWSAVRVAIRSPGDLILGLLAVLAFVSIWLVGLVLIAVTTAWRAAVWSVAYRDLWPQPALSPVPEPG